MELAAGVGGRTRGPRYIGMQTPTIGASGP